MAVTGSHTSRDQPGREEAITHLDYKSVFHFLYSPTESFTAKMNLVMELQAPGNRAFIR